MVGPAARSVRDTCVSGCLRPPPPPLLRELQDGESSYWEEGRPRRAEREHKGTSDADECTFKPHLVAKPAAGSTCCQLCFHFCKPACTCLALRLHCLFAVTSISLPLMSTAVRMTDDEEGSKRAVFDKLFTDAQKVRRLATAWHTQPAWVTHTGVGCFRRSPRLSDCPHPPLVFVGADRGQEEGAHVPARGGGGGRVQLHPGPGSHT